MNTCDIMTYQDFFRNQTTIKQTLSEFWVGVTSSNKYCSQTKTFSYRFTKICFSRQFQMFNWNKNLRYFVVFLCGMQYCIHFCQLFYLQSKWMWCDARYEYSPTSLMISRAGICHTETVQGNHPRNRLSVWEPRLRSLEEWHVSKELVKGTCPRIRWIMSVFTSSWHGDFIVRLFELHQIKVKYIW